MIYDEQDEDITMGNQQENLTLIPIPAMEGYFTNGTGDIYSTVKTGKPVKLKTHQHFGRSKNPYRRLCMGQKLFLAHRIIASVHVGRPLTKDEQVNHKNAVTDDNDLTNLEVVSARANYDHAVKNKLFQSGDDWYRSHGYLDKIK